MTDHPVERTSPLRCPQCGSEDDLSSRRDFLHQAGSLFACFAALGVVPGDSVGFTVRLTTALRRAGAEALYPIPKEDGANIDRDRELILVRYQDRVYAFGLSCPHQRTALRWEQEERSFRCPKHKSTFQLDGALISGRATRSLDRYALRREADSVIVDLSALLQEDRDRERWVEAVVRLQQ